MKIEHEDYYESSPIAKRKYLAEAEATGRSISKGNSAARSILLLAEAVLLFGLVGIILWNVYKTSAKHTALFGHLISGSLIACTIFALIYIAGRAFISFEHRNWELQFERHVKETNWHESRTSQLIEVAVGEEEPPEVEEETEDTSKPLTEVSSRVKGDWILVTNYRNGASLNDLALQKFGTKGGFYINKIKEILRQHGESI